MDAYSEAGLWKGNLPSARRSFVGRQAELSELMASLGRAWLVELSLVSEPSPNAVALSVYEALGLADQTARPALEVVAEWLADKHLLLILDCCEHLPPDCTRVVSTLLAAAPGLRVLATSRRPLGLPGEQVLPVPPLATAPPCGFDAAGCEAARLFVQRAADAAPAAIRPDRDGAAVVEICTQLEGIPLAIELAAARLPEMPLDTLRRRLHARFDTLISPDPEGSAPEEGEVRHQALRTTIGWSHELCAPLERLAWARLSIFAGSWEREAAMEICAGGPLTSEQLPALLEQLADASLLQRTDTLHGPRYSMLDTVRDYGREWLARLGEEQRLRTRHRDYFRRLALRGGREFIGPDQVAWYERARTEHTNLRAALECCLADPDPLPALQMAGDLWFFWTACGHHKEGRRYLEQALDKEPDPPEGPELRRALWACGCVALIQGDARTTALEGRLASLASRLADPMAAEAMRYLHGTRLMVAGRPAQALAVLDDGTTHAPVHSSSLALRLLSLSVAMFCRLQMGEIAQTVTSAHALREECERHGELWLRAYTLYFLAMAALAQGDLAAAARHARDSLSLKMRLHDLFGIAVNLDVLAAALTPAGPKQAARLLGIADAAWRSIGRPQAAIPELVTARQACEEQLRAALGDAAYESAHRTGLEADIDKGITYALHCC